MIILLTGYALHNGKQAERYKHILQMLLLPSAAGDIRCSRKHFAGLQ